MEQVKETSILSIQNSVTSKQAERILYQKSRLDRVHTQKKIYYPYYWRHYHFTFAIQRHKRPFEAHILVDMINNTASSADRFSLDTLDVDEDLVIDPDISIEKASETAQTYLQHSITTKLKMLFVPRKEIIDEKVIHKPFWLVRCSSRNQKPFFVIVDALNGKYQILPCKN